MNTCSILHGRSLVVDIDGTISDTTHRQSLAPRGDERDKDEAWRRFHAGMADDPPVAHVRDIVRGLRMAGAEVIFLTSRPDEYRETTHAWLRRHAFPDSEPFTLIMRPEGNRDKSRELKPRLLAERYGAMRYALLAVLAVIEDDVDNIEAFRALGFPVVRIEGYGRH